MKRKSGYRSNAIVAILPVLILVVLYVLEFNTGHVFHVSMKISESELYSISEIEEAASVLKCYFFLNMPGFELRELSYEEETAYSQLTAEAEEMGKQGRVIIFEAVYVRLHGYDGEGENNIEQSKQWILIRDSEAGKWRVDVSARP